jgi:hypothetical protein
MLTTAARKEAGLNAAVASTAEDGSSAQLAEVISTSEGDSTKRERGFWPRRRTPRVESHSSFGGGDLGANRSFGFVLRRFSPPHVTDQGHALITQFGLVGIGLGSPGTFVVDLMAQLQRSPSPPAVSRKAKLLRICPSAGVADCRRSRPPQQESQDAAQVAFTRSSSIA